MKRLKRKLLSKFNRYTESPMEQLKKSIEKGDNKKTAKLILQITNIDNEGGILPPLLIAVETNNAVAVEALLDAGADPNKGTTAFKESPVEMAIKYGFIKVAAILAERGADVTGYMPAKKETFLNAVINKALDTETKPSNKEEAQDYLRLINAIIKNGDHFQINRVDKYDIRPIEKLFPEVLENEFLQKIADTLVKNGAKINNKFKKQLDDCKAISSINQDTYKKHYLVF